jgi:Ca-activated chloride channel homolog
MNGCPNRDELEELAAGELYPAGAKRVRDHAAACEACGRLLVEIKAHERTMGDLFGTSVKAMTLEQAGRIEAGLAERLGVSAAPAATFSPVAHSPRGRRILVFSLAVAAAACVACVVVFWPRGQRSGSPAVAIETPTAVNETMEQKPYAWVAGRIDAGLAARPATARPWREIVAGDAVPAAQVVRVSTHGRAELRGGASRVVLGPGARATPLLTDDGRREVRLERGIIRVQAAAGDAIAVETLFGRLLTDEGEAVASAENGRARVRLEKGHARFVPSRGAETILEAGAVYACDGASCRILAGASAPEIPPPARRGREGAVGRLAVKDTLGREMAPLEIQELRVKARVDGPAAVTEIEETFYNPTDRRAEGVFYFAIPAGAAVTRLAMWVDGTLVEGELVEREKAARVYETIVRRMQDPALMEWQDGQVFKTRIFPIEAKSPKRILVAYMQTLPASDGTRRYVYPIAGRATTAGAIGRFEMDLEISDLAPGGAVRIPAWPDATVDRTGASAHVRVERMNMTPDTDFVARFEPNAKAGLEILTDRRKDEQGFFLLSYMPAKALSEDGAPRQERDLVLLVDTSLSRGEAEYAAQIDVAETLLSELDPADRFSVIMFDAAAKALHPKFVSGVEEAKKAMDALRAVKPLGGTDVESAIKALDAFLNAAGPHKRLDVALIGDGMATLGETRTERLAAAALKVLKSRGARLHTVAVGARQDRLLLRELACGTGGLYRTIHASDDVRAEAFRMALDMESPLRPPIDISFSGVRVSEVYPEKPDTAAAGEELIVFGRCAGAGKLSIKVQGNGLETSSADFILPETDSSSVLLPQLWAREKLDALLLAQQTADLRVRMIDLSQEFGLMTPHTSFLVLENEAAYKQYEIPRQLRRRYWAEKGLIRSAPPETVRPETSRPAPDGPIAPVLQPQTPAVNAPVIASAAALPLQNPPPSRMPPPATPPKPNAMDDIDVSLLFRQVSDGREVSTALASMTLAVYYRYLPIYNDGKESEKNSPPVPIDAPSSYQVVQRPAVAVGSGPIQVWQVRPALPVISEPDYTPIAAIDLAACSARHPEDEDLSSGGEDFLKEIPLEGEWSADKAAWRNMLNAFGWADGAGRRNLAIRHGGARPPYPAWIRPGSGSRASSTRTATGAQRDMKRRASRCFHCSEPGIRKSTGSTRIPCGRASPGSSRSRGLADKSVPVCTSMRWQRSR